MKASIAKMLHQRARRNFARSARRLVRAMKMANDSLTELARSKFMAGSVGFVSKKSIVRVNWRPRICVVASAIAISCVPGTATGALAKEDHNVNSIASIAADGGSFKMTKQEIKAEHIAQRAAADAAKAAAQLQNFNTNTMMQSAVNSAQSAMQAAALNVSTQAAAAAAQAGVQSSMQNLGSQAMAAQNTAVNLNLKSGKNDFFADISAPVNIMVGGSINASGAISGGKIMTINPGDKLSAAEHTAMLQSMSGNQTLLLGNNGAAQGGSLTLNGATSSSFGNLAIPKNVSLNLVGFDSANALDVAGKTNIMGSVYALQNSGNVGSVFNLGSLNVHGSGVWTGSLPSSTTVSGLFSSSSLTFNVTSDVTNAGQILSPGALNINAGGPISNIGPTAVMSGSAVSLSSQQAIFNSGMIAATAGNVNLNSSVGQITNSGIVQSTLGNINIASQIPTNLTINNIGGLMSAVDGAINIGDPSFTQKIDTTMTGGDWDSKTVNITSGDGHIVGQVNKVTGQVNMKGGTAHFYADTDNLNLGNVEVTGDPAFTNTGDITISGNQTTGGAPLAYVAGGDIITTVPGLTINTTGATGGDLTMIAGANFTVSGGLITVTGAKSPDGGKIDLATSAITNTSLDTRGTAGQGGNVTLIAFDGEGLNSGRILIPTGVTIQTSGSSGNASGNVTIIAADRNAAATQSIVMGGVNTYGTGGAAGTGNITIAAADIVMGGNFVINNTTGAVVSGSFSPGANQPRGVSITGNLVSNGAVVDLRAGATANSPANALLVAGNIDNSVKSGTANGGSVSINIASANTFQVGAASQNGVTGFIRSNGSLGGGNISIINNSTGGISIAGNANNLQVNATNGPGGSITLRSVLGPINMVQGTYSVSAVGGNNNGGTIDIEGDTFAITGAGTGLFTANGTGTGNGGSISIKTHNNSSNLTVGSANGNIRVSATGGSVGSAAGNGGTIYLSAGNNLTVNTTNVNAGPLGTNGNGAFIHLEAGAGTSPAQGNLLITPLGVSANGAGTGAGGTVELISNSSTTFNVGAASGSNRIAGSVSANALGTGDGGTVRIVNRGSGGIGIASPSNITASSAAGNGGTIILDATTGATDGALTFSAGGTIDVHGGGANGNGGVVVLNGSTVTSGGSMVIDAYGTGAGNGGRVTITATSTTGDVTLGSGTGEFTINAYGGLTGGDGGIVNITAGRNITTNAGGLNTQAGTSGDADGAIVNLTAGTGGSGNLFVDSSIDANGNGTGDGGTITLISASTTSFTVNPGATLNGVNGTISANGVNGGTITVINQGTSASNGGITLPVLTNIGATASNGNGGTIVLDATQTANPDGQITIASGTLTNGGTGPTGQGGNVTILGSSLNITGGTGLLEIQANGTGTGAGGRIDVETTDNTNNLVIDGPAGSGPRLSLSAVGVDGGTIIVKAGNNLTVNDVAFVNAGNLGGAGGHYDLEAGNGLVPANGNLFVNGALNASGTSGGSVRLVSQSGSVFDVNNGVVTNGINGTIVANATNGSGGTIEIINEGSGGINLRSTNNINVDAAGNGSGGRIYIDATGGVVTIPVSVGNNVLNAHGVGAGAQNGGTIDLRGSNVDVSGGTTYLDLDAYGSGTGNGGTVRIYESGTSGITLGHNPGNFCINVESGANGGNGGTVDLRSQGTITVDPVCMETGPQGPNGNGANITLYAGTQGCGGNSGNLVFLGDLIADGVGTGNGGIIDIGVHSTSVFNIAVLGPNGVQGVISAKGGTTAGNGGQVFLKNWDTGGITMTKPTDITVTAFHGNGGTIDINAAACSTNRGAVTIPTTAGVTTLDASAGGGNFVGGTINITGTQVNVGGGGGSLIMTADGSGTGSGGFIHITTVDNATGDIVIGTAANNVQLSAQSGAAGGNGGTIILDAAHSIVASSGNFNVDPSASGNGTGGTIRLHAGTGGAGLLQVTGNVTANGAGNGAGGIVEITLPLASSAGPLIVGAAGGATQSYVTGFITADAPGTGHGGDVTIKNTSNSDLDITLSTNGTISANSSSGILGNVNFVVNNSAAGSGQDIHVNPGAAGQGTITGFVNATANQVQINANAVNETLNVGTITGTDGMVILDAANTGGQIRVGEGRHVSATQDILMTTNKVTINGLVDTSETNGNIQIVSVADLVVVGEGTVATNGTGTNLINVAAADGFDLTLTSNINYVPTTASSTVRFGAMGSGGDIFVTQGTSQTIASGATLQIETPTLHLGNGSGFTATGASQVNINSGTVGSNPLTIETVGGGSATISTAGGPGKTIDITAAGNQINFTHSGSGNSTLNLNGADIEAHVNAPGALINITSQQTVSGNRNICIELDGGTDLNPAVFTNNGTLQTSSNTAGTTINIGAGAPTLGSGTNYMNVTGTGTVALTGNPASGLVQLHAFDDRLTILGNQTLNAGTGGTVTLGGYETGGGPGVEMKSGSSINVTGGTALNIKTYHLQLEQNSSITNSVNGAATNITLGTITACEGQQVSGVGAITITSQGTGTNGGRLQTTNGNVNITPTAGSALTFDTIGGLAGTLNIIAGTGNVNTTVSNSDTTVAADTNLHVSATQLTMNVNNGTLQNNGFINVDNNNNAGRLNILSTGTLNVPVIANISVDPLTAGTNADGGRIDIIAAGALSISNGTLRANAVATGTDANGSGGQINVSGSTIAITSGAPLLLQANGLGTGGNGGAITFRALGATGDVTTGGGSGLVSMEAKGGTTGNGGSVTVVAGRNVQLDGTAIDVSAGTTGNGGTVDITASNAGTNGSLILSTGIDAKGGTNSGNGGTIRLTNNSTANLVVDKPLDVSAGLSGAGGRIEIRNEGGGNIDVQTALHADSNGANQNAGTIWLDANGAGTDGTVILNTIPFSATATGSGNGGTITVEGGQIQIVGTLTPQQIIANAGTTGAGGTINLIATSATGDISLAPGAAGLTLAARGGSTSGDGGTINLNAGRNISIQGNNTVLDVSPQGGNSRGGNLSLLAGQTATTGLVQVNGELNADGSGNGNGGSITVNYRDPLGGTFVVGNTSAGSYVNGTIHADSVGTGTGGTVTFTNADSAGTSVGDMNIVLDGPASLISAGTAAPGTANLGNVNFNNSGNDVNVSGLNAVDGTLTGFVNSTGTTVFINPKAVDTTLVAGTVTATAGTAHLEVNCDDNSQLIVPLGKSVVSNTGDAELEGHTINIAGLVQGQNDVKLEVDSLTNTGTVRAVTGSLYIDACLLGGPLSVVINGPGVFQADNGNIAFNTLNSGGTISVTGTGNVGTNPNGQVIFGVIGNPNTVFANVNSFVGNITGAGTTVDITAQNGDLFIGTPTNQLTATAGDMTLTAVGATSGGNITFRGDATASQDIRLRPDTATGVITVNTGADVHAGRNALVVSGTTGSVVLQSGGTITGDRDVRIATPTLDMSAGNNSITATTGDIYLSSSVNGGPLNITMGAGSSLNASTPGTGDILINDVFKGAITINNAGNGTLNAGNLVSFNGGENLAPGAVLVDVEQINGNIVGTGSSVTIRTDNGNLNIGTTTGGTLTSTTGDVDLTARGLTSSGNVNIQGDTTSASNYNITSDLDGTGTVNFSNGADLTATNNVDINSGNLVLGGVAGADNSSIVSNAGDITIHNSVGAHTLLATLPDQSLIQATNGDVTFNLVGQEGAITINGGAGVGTTGAINAGSSNAIVNEVTFNSGNNQMSVGVEHIHGCIDGQGDSFLLTVVNVSPFTNDVHLGNITSHNDFNFTSPGAITICGNIAVSNATTDPSITLNTAPGSSITQLATYNVTAEGTVNYNTTGGAVTLQDGADISGGLGVNIDTTSLVMGGTTAGDNSSITSSAGDINIFNSTGAHSLSVTMPATSLMETVTGDVNFNTPGATGAITINGGAGVGNTGAIHAGNSATEIHEVWFNGGTNQVSVGVNNIHGCINGTGDPFLITVQAVSPFTGDVHLGNITTNVDFSFTSPGALTICGNITANGAGSDITLNTAAGSTITQEATYNVVAGGVVSYTTNGGTVTLQDGADIQGGTGVNINTLNLVMGGTTAGDDSSITVPTGDINIFNSNGAHTLNVTMPATSLIETVTGNVNFNTPGATGAITVNGGAGVGTTGAIHAGNSGTEVHEVWFNGGTNQVSVGVDNIHGCINGSGDPFAITVQNVSPYTNNVHLGNITTNVDFSFTSPGALVICGNITANGAGSDITLNTAAGSSITQEATYNVNAGGIVSYNTNGGSITLQDGADIAGNGGVNLDAASLIMGGTTAGDNSSITSSGGDINIFNSNGAHGLIVTMPATSLIETVLGDINFNTPGATGAITINGGAGVGTTGEIHAGNSAAEIHEVWFNGGTNQISVGVENIHGCINGSGDPFLVTVQNVSPFTNNVHLGNITTNVDFNFTSPGALVICGNITANGAGSDITLNTAAGSSITQEATWNVTAGGVVNYNTNGGTITLEDGADIAGNAGINLDSRNLIMGGTTAGDNSSITSASGDINIFNSNGTHALAVTMPATSLIETVTGNVNFNTSGATGAITINGGAGVGTTGAIHAGNSATEVHEVWFNGGTNQVSVGVDNIHGCINGTGDPFNITVQNVSPYTGDVHLGNITTNVDFSFTSPGALTICGNITANGAGSDITLNTAAGSSITQEATYNVVAGGVVNYNTNGGTVTLQDGADIQGGAGVNIDTNNLVMGGTTLGDDSSITAPTGDINIFNSNGAHALIVTMPATSLIETVTGNVNFNTPGATGAITINGGAGVGTTGAIHAGNSGTDVHEVWFNGGTNQISVGVDNIHGCINGSGDPFMITVQNVSPYTNNVHLGNITTNVDFSFTSPGALVICGNITANGAGSDITLNTASGSSITQEATYNVTAGGVVNYNTDGGTITLEDGADIAGNGGVNLDAGTFNMGGTTAGDNSSVTSSGGDINIFNSNGAHTLIVNMPATSLIETVTGDVNFNLVGQEGAITVNGGATGTTGSIHAGNSALEIHEVTFNGGTNEVHVGVNDMHGCVGGSGDPLDLHVVAVSPYTNDVHLGDITTNVDFLFTSPGDLTICGPITANGAGSDITLNTPGGNTITQQTGSTVDAGGNVNYNTSNLDLSDITNSGGDINITNPTGSGVPLNVSFNPGSELNGGNNVNFVSNGANQGISVTGGPDGLISAGVGTGIVDFQGGANPVSVNVGEIDGNVTGAGTVVTIVTATGDLVIGTGGGGTLTATSGDLTVTANGGGVTFEGDATASNNVFVNSGNGIVNLDPNADVIAQNGNITVVSITPGANPLVVTLGTNSTLSTPNGNVNFNSAASEGQITITGDGSILAPGHDVYYYNGNSPFVVDIREIQGCNHLESSTGSFASVDMTTQQGSIDFCTDINTTNPTGVGGNINITANGGPINLEGNNVIASGAGGGGNINLTSAGGITDGGNIISNGTNNSSGGNINLTSNGNNIVVGFIQTLGDGTGNGGNITTVSSNLRATDCDANDLSIDAAGGAAGNGGNITITTTSTNPFRIGDDSVNGTHCGVGANGGNDGGTIHLNNNGGLVVNTGEVVQANGGNNGGLIVIGLANPGSGPLTVINNGLIEATNPADTTGLVAFNTGPGQDLDLDTRGGIVHAGDCIHLGNVDYNTGAVVAPPGGKIHIKGRNNLISDCIEINGRGPVPPNPPPPPTPPNNGGGTNPLLSFFEFLAGGGILPFLPSNGNVNDFFVLSKTPTDITPSKRGYVSDEMDEEAAFIKQVRRSKMCGLIEGEKTFNSLFAAVNDSEVSRLQSAGIQVATNTKDNFFNLNKGNVIFAPSKDMVVGTHEGNVHIPAGAIAFIMENGNDVAIFDFHQTNTKSIRVVSGGKLITLDPGRMVLLSREKTDNFEEITHHCRCIGYRHAKTEQLNDSIRAFAMDFSIPSALNAVMPFKQMLASSVPQEKKVIEKLMMDAVLLQESTAFRGPFKTAHE